ncbi:MAG: hypothetical protein M3Y27_24305 [Acidobacteriota bacterium]|nr:hypothetical protein [Acidobacteriota bacterium]
MTPTRASGVAITPAIVVVVLTEEDLVNVLSAARKADAHPKVMVAGFRTHQLIARRPG